MNSGKILLADDEAVFSAATADLLRREGFEVTTVPDAPSAMAAASEGEWDLVISDLEMPGNDDMALIRRLAETNGGLPVIVVTGYPSARTAMSCIELPVAAYLTKPLDFEVLLEKTRAAVKRYRAWSAMRRSEERLREWREEMSSINSLDAGQGGVDSFLALTLRNVMGSLTDIQHVGEALGSGQAKSPHTCQLINCPRGAQLHQAVRESVDVLEATKGAFKSKALGDLRRKLELLLDHA